MPEQTSARMAPELPSSLFFDPSRKRFRDLESSPMPTLFLDKKGNIIKLTPAARRMLGYAADDWMEPYFCSHVNGRNMAKVIRDLEAMTKAKKRQAFWLLRLRTRKGRWKWFRVSAENFLHLPDATIALTLRDLLE